MPGLIIIPAHNEEAAIGAFLDELKTELFIDADIVVVDDGSSDNTAKIAKQKGLLCCTLACNLGYTGALKTGLEIGLKNDYQWMAFIDADGQHRPKDLQAMTRFFTKAKVDLLVGSRWLEKNSSQKTAQGRRLGMEFFAWLTQKLTGHPFTDTTNGLKVMSPDVAKELVDRNFGDFHAETLIYLHDRGYRIEEHPIIVRERETGNSMYSLKDIVFYPLKNLILIALFKLNSWTLAKLQQS